MKKSIYSIPKLCKSKQGWYIHFRYSGVQKRYKMKLNYIDNLAKREREFNMLKRALHQKLKEGINLKTCMCEIKTSSYFGKK